MDEIWRKIEQNTAPKDSFQITVSGNSSDFITKLHPPLQLKKGADYEIALLNMETYYSFPNIDTTNNNFKHSPESGSSWFEVQIPERCYEVDNLNDAVKCLIKNNNHNDSSVDISANTNTLKTVLELKNNYQVDFSIDNSLRTVLGFNEGTYTGNYQESENIVNIVNANSILVNIDIITDSYINGSMQKTIYSFFPDVSQGFKIIEKPAHTKYLQVTLDTITNLRISLTDQNGKFLNLRGEVLTIRYDLRER